MDHLPSERQHDADGHEPDALAVRPRRSRAAFGLWCACGVALLTALGVWQLERRSWKLALLAEIAERMAAAPTDLPEPASFGREGADTYAYRRVHATGEYLHDRETLVWTATRLGSGYWVLTPLRTPGGLIVLVNRGFVPAERAAPAARAAGLVPGPAVVDGLVRLTEPKGAWLRHNDPAAGRWYSRDVAAIAAAKQLGNVAPYFVDADATPVPGGLPVGGLTVTSLPNNHLVYALTWFSLALLLAGVGVLAFLGVI
jgi:surfeit locus 1 family protein